MRPEMVIEMLEGIDVLGDLVDVVWQVDDGVELVSPGAIASLDGAVELRRVRRQDVEWDGLCGARLLELGHELGAAVDLYGFDGPRHFGGDLVEEVGGIAGGGVAIGLGHGPLGIGVVSVEMLTVSFGESVTERVSIWMTSPGFSKVT